MYRQHTDFTASKMSSMFLRFHLLSPTFRAENIAIPAYSYVTYFLSLKSVDLPRQDASLLLMPLRLHLHRPILISELSKIAEGSGLPIQYQRPTCQQACKHEVPNGIRTSDLLFGNQRSLHHSQRIGNHLESTTAISVPTAWTRKPLESPD